MNSFSKLVAFYAVLNINSFVVCELLENMYFMACGVPKSLVSVMQGCLSPKFSMIFISDGELRGSIHLIMLKVHSLREWCAVWKRLLKVFNTSHKLDGIRICICWRLHLILCAVRFPRAIVGTALASVPAMQSSDHFPLFHPIPRFCSPIQLASVGQATLRVDSARRQPFEIKSGYVIGNFVSGFAGSTRGVLAPLLLFAVSKVLCCLWYVNKES
jgi:hypothetical protein